MHDAFDLKRFVDAQEPVFGEVLLELERGHKRTHWMWFVFPQHVALGMSTTAKHFGIHSIAEAQAYLHHPVLGARLRQCCETLMNVEGRSSPAALTGTAGANATSAPSACAHRPERAILPRTFDTRSRWRPTAPRLGHCEHGRSVQTESST